MVLDVRPGDYLDGTDRVILLVERILSTSSDNGTEWVAVSGLERPSTHSCWRPRRLKIRVSALKRSMTLNAV